jgi:hypothetical protein
MQKPKQLEQIPNCPKSTVQSPLSCCHRPVASMFVLKGLGKIIWGDPDKSELVQITSGQLYLVRPKNSVKGTSECM